MVILYLSDFFLLETSETYSFFLAFFTGVFLSSKSSEVYRSRVYPDFFSTRTTAVVVVRVIM